MMRTGTAGTRGGIFSLIFRPVSENEAETSIRRRGDKRRPAINIPGVRVGSQLGFGGMATVFEGWDDGFNPPRRVAIKLMNSELSSDPAFRVRFEREASLVADFRHDNIVHVYASGESAGVKYIVMEHLGGGTLADKLAKGALPPVEAVSHAAALCDALAYSHKRGIVHRDVKPANVLFTADGKPILSDFGVAKSSSTLSGALTQQASVVGAPRYMAPEQELGDHVSDRADVYSLGLTLYEMLTGEPPSAAVRLQRIVDEQNHFAQLLPHLPSSVTELLHRCLQLDPAARPAAAEFARHLHAAAASLSVSAAPHPTRSPLRAWLIASGCTAVVLAVAGALWLRSHSADMQSTSPPAGKTVLVYLQRTPASAQLYLDGRLIAQPTVEIDPGPHRLVAVARGHYGELRTVHITERAAANPIAVELQPTLLPTAAQFEQFLDLADATSISAEDRDRVGEQTLRTALSTKLLRQNGASEAAQALALDLQALAEVGDARSAVVLLLAPAVEAGRISPTTIDDRVLAAADAGDAMASFFVALTFRSRVQQATERGHSGAAALQAYCQRMTQAAAQGWSEVAVPYLQRDGCR
jgi:serine/threonine protein kinase